MGLRRFLWPGLALGVAVLLAVGLGAALSGHGSSPGGPGHGQSPLPSGREHGQSASAGVLGRARGGAGGGGRVAHLALPACARAPGPLPGVVVIRAAGGDFTRRCYYGAARRPLIVRFTSSVVSVGNQAALPLTLLISPGQHPALAPIAGTPLGIGIKANAVFAGAPVAAPHTGRFAVPALAAGTYAVQIQQLPHFLATLVVR